MTKFEYVLLGLIALAFAVFAMPSPARGQGPYCLIPQAPPRAHNNYEPVNRWAWDNRRVA